MNDRKSILVVDDENSIRLFLSLKLNKLDEGYEVETAASGEDAWAKIAARSFDLVITDLRMPGIDGIELMEKIKTRHPQTFLLPMTAFCDREHEVRFKSLGINHYLTKPFTFADLLDATRQALR